MDRRVKILELFLIIFLILAVAHSLFHFYVFGTGVSGLYDRGISSFSIGGFTVGEEDVGEEKTGVFSIGASVSQIVVIIEWIVLLALLVIYYMTSTANIKKEITDLQSRKEKKKSGTKTDLDELYELLQVRKRIRFLAIEKVFGVNRDIVITWAKTLESGNLATIEYPRFGEPELVLIEKDYQAGDIVDHEKEK